MNTKLTDRRDFLKASAVATLFPAPLIGAQSKDKKYRTALIGCGWWGMNILNEAMAARESTVVAMCDVDENQLNPAAAKVQELSGDQPKKYKDYREMLLKEKPEIVIVGTPDHWHALCMIAAVNAGAHVYVEKPIGHTVREGRAMVNAARAANRVVQVGTHRRISPHNVSGREFIKSGKLGKIGMVPLLCIMAAALKSRKRTPSRRKVWIGICGAARLRSGPSTKRFTREASATSSITPTARSAIGAFTGWIRFCGSLTRNTPNGFFQPEAAPSLAPREHERGSDHRRA